MEEPRTDRRVRKTKKQLRMALTTLMMEKSVGEITVREIAELADVNRGTFYAHYTDIYDLLKQMDRLTCLFATHVIPEGEGVRQLLMAEKVTGKPLEILAHGNVNGVDPDYFRRSGCREEVRERLELPEED